VLLPIAAIDAWVDPYDLLGWNKIGIYVSNERLAKPILIRNANYQTIIIGSSKVAAISPADIPNTFSFNASFGAALPEEMAWFLDRYARFGQAVAMGLDFYMFNENAFIPVAKDPFAEENRPSAIAYLIDINVLELSLHALTAHNWSHAEPLVLADGTRNQADDWAQNNALSGYNYARVLKTLRENHYHDIRYSTHRVEVLRDLKREMTRRGVKLVTFINPLNVEVRALIQKLGEAQFQQFRRDMHEIFPDIYDLTGIEFSNRDLYYKHDPYHYKPAVGACFISQILSGRRPVVPPRSPDNC